MPKERAGKVIFVCGIALAGIATLMGKGLAPEVHQQGLIAYVAAHGGAGALTFAAFAFGFPLGIGVSVTGAALLGGARRSRVLLFAALALAAMLPAVLVPAVFGGGTSPGYFGVGGVLLLVLIAAVLWLWADHRRGLPQRRRGASDWQALGYLFFALAAWNLCGVGGMPGYALYPDKMLQFNAHAFAVGQLKAVMACFLLGWLFTALGFYQATRD